MVFFRELKTAEPKNSMHAGTNATSAISKVTFIVLYL